MSEIEEVTVEPVRWPIAPDGYIPNSTIRSWSRGGRSLGVVKGWDDICFPEDYSSDEDDSGRVFWLGNSDEDEDEEEITFRVKRRRKEEDDRGEGDTTDEMGSEDNTELEEKKDEMKRRFPSNRPLDLQTTTPRNHEVGKMRQEAGPTYSSRTLENVLPTSSHGNRPEPREEVKVPEVVTSPPQYRPEPRRTSSFIPEPPEPLVQRPVATTDHFIPKQSYCRQQDPVQELPRPQARDTRIKKTAKPRFTAGPPTAEPRDWTPQHQESEPSIPEDPQPQPDPDPPEDKRFLLSAAKYDNVVDCDYACLDSKVLRVYKDRNRNMSRRGKLSQPPNAPKVIRYTAGVRLVDGLRNASARAKSSTVQTRPNRVRHPNGGRRRLLRPDSAQSVQTFTYSEDPMDLEPEPELTSLQGFCPASQATTNPPVTVKPSNVEQLVASMTAVQLGQVPAPQPVVRRIEMKETQALSPAHFHYLILLASQRNVFALDPCGETPHGNMQVDWMALTCCS